MNNHFNRITKLTFVYNSVENKTHTASDVNGASKLPTRPANDVTPSDGLL